MMSVSTKSVHIGFVRVPEDLHASIASGRRAVAKRRREHRHGKTTEPGLRRIQVRTVPGLYGMYKYRTKLVEAPITQGHYCTRDSYHTHNHGDPAPVYGPEICGLAVKAKNADANRGTLTDTGVAETTMSPRTLERPTAADRQSTTRVVSHCHLLASLPVVEQELARIMLGHSNPENDGGGVASGDRRRITKNQHQLSPLNPLLYKDPQHLPTCPRPQEPPAHEGQGHPDQNERRSCLTSESRNHPINEGEGLPEQNGLKYVTLEDQGHLERQKRCHDYPSLVVTPLKACHGIYTPSNRPSAINRHGGRARSAFSQGTGPFDRRCRHRQAAMGNDFTDIRGNVRSPRQQRKKTCLDDSGLDCRTGEYARDPASSCLTGVSDPDILLTVAEERASGSQSKNKFCLRCHVPGVEKMPQDAAKLLTPESDLNRQCYQLTRAERGHSQQSVADTARHTHATPLVPHSNDLKSPRPPLLSLAKDQIISGESLKESGIPWMQKLDHFFTSGVSNQGDEADLMKSKEPIDAECLPDYWPRGLPMFEEDWNLQRKPLTDARFELADVDRIPACCQWQPPVPTDSHLYHGPQGSGDDVRSRHSDISSKELWESLDLALWRENVLAATSFRRRGRKQSRGDNVQQPSEPARIQMTRPDNDSETLKNRCDELTNQLRDPEEQV